jgi:hypothetical protein
VPKVQSWRSRIGAILSALEQIEATVLDRSDMEELFKLQRRAALRLMERVGPIEEAGEWRIDRVNCSIGFRNSALRREMRTSGPGRCAMPCGRRNRRITDFAPNCAGWGVPIRLPGRFPRRYSPRG